MIKIRTIITGIIGMIIMVLGIWNIFEHSSFWTSIVFVVVGGIILLIALFFEPIDSKEIKNEQK